MKCKCGNADLYQHTGAKEGKYHCNECGSCEYYGDTPNFEVLEGERPGVTPIPQEVVKGAKEGVADADAVAPEDSPTPERRTRRKK